MRIGAQAFLLLEALVALAVFAIVGGGFLLAYQNLIGATLESERQRVVQQVTLNALRELQARPAEEFQDVVELPDLENGRMRLSVEPLEMRSQDDVVLSNLWRLQIAFTPGRESSYPAMEREVYAYE
ncbi:MAG: hypothetical protein ACFCU3_11830 [Verrucomicrobiales bacterium]